MPFSSHTEHVFEHDNRVINNNTVASESARRVMLLSVIPIARITANVPISETGIATAAIIVLRRLRRKKKNDYCSSRASQNQVMLNVFDGLSDE
jgi:hypothetical protein